MLTRRTTLAFLTAGTALGGGALLLSGGGADGLPDLGAAHAQGSVEIEDISIGDPDAPVKVVEYASFTCPHCAAFHNETFKAFREEYVETGKVHYTYREVFFDRYGLWASMVARCAGTDRYLGIADLIYSSQQSWARQDSPAAVADSLKRIGAQAGLSQETLDACLQDAEMAESLVAWYQGNADRDGIRSTPSFLINGDLHAGNMSLEQIGRLVDEASS
ncbi:MAG: DsbA family protein [Pseudomonadota bacterium]